MELCTEMKLVGDTYGSGFGCGLTLTGSATIRGFEKVGEDPSSLRYENGKGLALTVHKRQEQDALRVWTEFANHSGEAVTLEMLASFALQDVEADAIYRLQSFWSAEGKLRRETVYDLHLEPSWSGHGSISPSWPWRTAAPATSPPYSSMWAPPGRWRFPAGRRAGVSP